MSLSAKEIVRDASSTAAPWRPPASPAASAAPQASDDHAETLARRHPSRVDMRVRFLLGAVVAALIAFLLVRTWLIDRYQIDGSSMAESLHGAHASIDCSSCGLRFDVGIEGGATAGHPVVCPNCGYIGPKLTAEAPNAGDTVLLDRGAYARRTPRRWEVVVFREPAAANQIAVKRVVGLPGEEVQIVDGDVYVDGRLARKNLAEQRALLIPVHDDRFRPSREDARCWRFSDSSGWRVTDNGYEYSPTGTRKSVANGAAQDANAHTEAVQPSHSESPALDWIAYRHIRQNGAGGGVEVSPIVDTYGYNQTFPQRDLHPARDLVLSFRMTASPETEVHLRASYGEAEFRCAISGAEVVLSHGGETVSRAALPSVRSRQGEAVVLSLVDRQVVLAVDGCTVLTYPFELSGGSAGSTAVAEPFAIAAARGGLRIEDLRIERDVYYGRPPDGVESAAFNEPLKLAEDEIFVVSDNAPLGCDSRTAAFGPQVPLNLLIGKPFIACGARQVSVGGGRGIQVPELFQIRYIRGPSANHK